MRGAEERKVAEDKREEENRKRVEEEEEADEEREEENRQRAEEVLHRVLEMMKEVRDLAREAAAEKKRTEEEGIAEEACSRICHLPEELKILILHHLDLSLLHRLNLAGPHLRSVLQAKEPKGTHQLVMSTWLPRLLTMEDKAALIDMAKDANLNLVDLFCWILHGNCGDYGDYEDYEEYEDFEDYEDYEDYEDFEES